MCLEVWDKLIFYNKMNFKPTKLKIIVAIIAAFIIAFIILSILAPLCFDCPENYATKLTIFFFLTFFILTFFPIYSIWSLFQGKKDKVLFYILEIAAVLVAEVVLFFIIVVLLKRLIT